MLSLPFMTASFTVEFVEDFLEGPSADERPGQSDTDVLLDDDPASDDAPQPEAGADVMSPQHTEEPAAPTRDRSRSPRQATSLVAVIGHSVSELYALQRPFRQPLDIPDMWPIAFTQDALLEGQQSLTSVPPWLRIFLTGDVPAPASPESRMAWLLTLGVHERQALFRMAALTATPIPWSHDVGDIFRSQVRLQVPASLALLDEVPTGTETSLASATFAILALHTTLEQLDLQVLLPQTVDQLLEVLEASRVPSKRQHNSRLIPVQPQPDDRWGTFLAFPPWAHLTALVCLDLTAFDGRIFAARAPSRVDRVALLRLAGLPPYSAAHIFRPLYDVFLADGEECQLQLGECVVFVRGGDSPHRPHSLSQMLQTTRGWRPGPPFPQTAGDPYYCVALDHGFAGFVLPPGEAPRFTTYVATCFSIDPQRLDLSPAKPKITDVALGGIHCRTVAAVGARPAHCPRHRTVGLLDCRPILEGWIRLEAPEGWISLENIRDGLLQSAPTGWSVHLTGCRAHWSWLWLQEGQTIVASFVPNWTPSFGLADSSTPAAADDGTNASPGFSRMVGPDVVSQSQVSRSSAEGQEDPHAWRGPWGNRRQLLADNCRGSITLCCNSDTPLRQCWPEVASIIGAICLTIVLWALVFAWPGCHVLVWGIWAFHSRRGVSGLSALGLIAFMLLSVRVEAMQTNLQGCSARLSLGSIPTPDDSCIPISRPLPTPCRAGSAPAHAPICSPQLGSCSDSSITIEGEDLHGLSSIGPTLLDDLKCTHGDPLFLEARAVLEVLIEHHACCSDHADPAPLCLEDHIPLTPHQESSLRLQAFLPHELPHEEVDWLDSDLTEVLAFQELALEIRTVLVNVPIWCQAGFPTPDRIDVFTDGSATLSESVTTPCAWAFAAFAVVGEQHYLIGHASSQAVPPGTPYFLGEVLDDALTAELLALCWSMCWAAQHLLHLSAPVCFRYDALGAGQGTFGAARPVRGATPEHYAPLAQFAVALRQYLNARRAVSHAHVPGHRGHVGNELCDALAKLARRAVISAYDRCLPEWPGLWAAHPLANWAWSTVPGQVDVPRLFCFEAEVALAQKRGPNVVKAPAYGQHNVHCPVGDASFCLSCVSLNVLTLRDKTAKLPAAHVGLRLMGRKDLLKATLANAQPLFLGLQETRLPESEVQADPDYLIYNSASTERGMGGCSLWIAKHVPLCRIGTDDTYIKHQDVTVVSTSPRHLTVHVQTSRLRMQLQVLHAPSTTSFPVDVVRAFWDDRAREMLHRPDGTDYIVLCDANSRLGDTLTEHVGDCGAEAEGAAGALFHEFLAKIDAIAPSTWPQWHQGPHATWFSPFDTQSRIDYVLIPRHWSTADITSRTMPDVELMQLRDDHVPVHLVCRFSRRLPGRSYSSVKKQVVRPVSPVEKVCASRELTRSVPVTLWGTAVDEHYSTLVAAWTHVGHSFAPGDERAPRQPYLTRATLDIVDERHTLCASLKVLKAETTRRLMLIIFAALLVNTAQGTFGPHQLVVADAWLREMDEIEAITLANFRRSTRALRRAVACDRTAYLGELTNEVARGSIGDPKSLYKVLRRAFPASRPAKRQHIAPLPMLKLADGSMAQSTEDRASAWRSHFAAQEAGEIADDQAYSDAFLRVHVTPWELDMRLLPTLAAVEQHILSAKVSKAVGPDGISAELLRLDVPITARQLLPVFLKSCLKVQEPVVFRGGDLCCLAKKAGQVMTCEAYRSILVSSVPGKIYHRCLREAVKPLLLGSQPPFQAGVAPGQGIEGVALAVRTFYALNVAKAPWPLWSSSIFRLRSTRSCASLLCRRRPETQSSSSSCTSSVFPQRR